MESVQNIWKLHRKISHTMWNFAWCVKFIGFLFSFVRCAKFIFLSLALYLATCTPIGISHAVRKFCIAMRNCWMLDFFSDSLPCILDWLGKGLRSSPKLGFFMYLSFNLLFHGLHKILPHSWLVLMIKSYQKHQNLPKPD